MGKRYHCDYCDKTMSAAPSIVKTHNNGTFHQKIVKDHYQQFKDAETILAEESVKKPCLRFARGDCWFGSICSFSHYSREELNTMRQNVSSRKNQNVLNIPSFKDLFAQLLNEKSTKPQEVCEKDGNTVMYDNNGMTHEFPWTYNAVFDSYGDSLPPSLKRMKIEDFNTANIVSWG